MQLVENRRHYFMSVGHCGGKACTFGLVLQWVTPLYLPKSLRNKWIKLCHSYRDERWINRWWGKPLFNAFPLNPKRNLAFWTSSLCFMHFCLKFEFIKGQLQKSNSYSFGSDWTSHWASKSTVTPSLFVFVLRGPLEVKVVEELNNMRESFYFLPLSPYLF